MSETERLDEQLFERLTEIATKQTDNSQALIGITAKLAVASQAQTLAYIELALALHDAQVLQKDVLAQRLRTAAAREDLLAPETTRELLRKYADGLDSAAWVEKK